MSSLIPSKLTRTWRDSIEPGIQGIEEVLKPINKDFESSGIHISVWRNLASKEPTNGIVVDGFLGYTEIAGSWGLR